MSASTAVSLAELESHLWEAASFADVQNAARVVSLDEIQVEDWTLNISRYPPVLLSRFAQNQMPPNGTSKEIS